jgi:hypothetical protein
MKYGALERFVARCICSPHNLHRSILPVKTSISFDATILIRKAIPVQLTKGFNELKGFRACCSLHNRLTIFCLQMERSRGDNLLEVVCIPQPTDVHDP